MSNEEKALVKTTIVMPLVSADEAVKAMDVYEGLKAKLVKPIDIQKIQGKDFLKKSYWRKLAKFFGLSVEVISEKVEEIEPKGNKLYSFVCRATAPNGQYAEGSGSCDLNEKGRFNTHHNVRATAETRAYNRAVSNLVGGGEVSAEEVDSDSVTDHKDTSYTQQEENKPEPARQKGYDTKPDQFWAFEKNGKKLIGVKVGKFFTPELLEGWHFRSGKKDTTVYYIEYSDAVWDLLEAEVNA